MRKYLRPELLSFLDENKQDLTKQENSNEVKKMVAVGFEPIPSCTRALKYSQTTFLTKVTGLSGL